MTVESFTRGRADVMKGTFLKGVVLGACVSTMVLVAATAYAGTGIGGVFNLGKTNTVNATSTLQGSSSKTLQVANSGSGPALGLHVQAGQPPLSTNSQTKVNNLNSDLLDGQDSSAFQLKSDSVRLDAPEINFGSSQSWDVGPYITLIASCDSSGGTSTLTLDLLDNSPSSGSWLLEDLINTATNPATPVTHGANGVISGGESVVTKSVNPPTQALTGSSDFATVIWRDTGETVTATYSSIAFANYCGFEGTATRTT